MQTKEQTSQGRCVGQFSGFVLVGGRSARMGRDKAFLPLGGRPLAALVAERVEQAAGSVTLLGGPGACAALGWPVLADEAPGCGPLSGIHCALKHSPAHWKLVVACDLPFLSVAFLRYLVDLAANEEAHSEGSQVIVPRSKRGYRLAGLFRYDVAPVVEDAIRRADFKLSHLYERVRCREVLTEEWAAFDPDGLLFENVNTPEDLECAVRRNCQRESRRDDRT